ncbi:MAG: family 1 glycosylhydrolase [Oscillospiraceae bacterium]|nr:family 1 glycosylhydrolase [Oscillospiraceae bacterium]
MSNFPKGFLIGAATAAHQVEGNNKNCDFWAMEQAGGLMFKEPSLDAVDHYNRYKEDVDLMAAAGLNAYRFSIEWARIEPQKGVFDAKEIKHYREVIEYCRSKGVEPMVTMHHFTSPKWLIEDGGWESEKTPDAFASYCAYVAKELGDVMEFVCTINEANMGLQITKIMKERTVDVQVGLSDSMGDGEAVMRDYMSKLSGVFSGINPREIHTFLSPRTERGDQLIFEAHEKARDAMKAVCPNLKVGITLSLYNYQSIEGGEENARQAQEEDFLHYLPYLQKDDFFGLQNYSRKIYGKDGIVPVKEGTEVTQMGYEYYPEALQGVIRQVHEHLKLPIYVTENGIATSDDSRRVEFIKRALAGVEACIADGIPVKGYMHWSLLDNFEWMLGYSMTFGLIAVDRTTQTRHPKESLKYLGKFS